jgi:hypothetical protein
VAEGLEHCLTQRRKGRKEENSFGTLIFASLFQ